MLCQMIREWKYEIKKIKKHIMKDERAVSKQEKMKFLSFAQRIRTEPEYKALNCDGEEKLLSIYHQCPFFF